MREIKFRVWDEADRNYYEVTAVNWEHGFLWYHNTCAGEHQSMGLNGETIIEQFTGLLDKNGKEIYEGDIVKDRFDEIWKVEYMSEYAAYILVRLNEDFSDTNFIGQIFNEDLNYYDMETIGNIHDGEVK